MKSILCLGKSEWKSAERLSRYHAFSSSFFTIGFKCGVDYKQKSEFTLSHSFILLRSRVSKIDFDAQENEQKSICYFVQLLNAHFERLVIDFHYFPHLFSIYHLCES